MKKLRFILHGENQVESRNFLHSLLSQAKARAKEILYFDGKDISLTEVKQALESKSLFGQDKLVVLENLFSSVQSNRKKEVLRELNNAFDLDIIIWEKKEISSANLKFFLQNWEIKVFKIPLIIFKLLDTLKPENKISCLTLLHQCLEKQAPELVFYLLCRQVRNLIIAKDLGNDGLDGAPWQKGKLIHQSSSYSLNKLLNIYHKLLEIDTSIKTGNTLMALDWHLDIVIAQL